MRLRNVAGLAVAALVLAACASKPSDDKVAAEAVAMMKASFKPHGQAKLDRLDQDETQRLCSVYHVNSVPKDVAAKIEAANLATVRYPADGKLVGNWKNGEKIAQSGRGFQYSDDPKAEAGANCYACHRLSGTELSYGTIGPSLYQFGKVRGNTAETQKYVYAKIFNAEAFAACSNMPRFGHKALLNEQQIKDLVALLVDPDSPVNK
jgi:sulfur-oxidizing protein SoxX